MIETYMTTTRAISSPANIHFLLMSVFRPAVGLAPGRRGAARCGIIATEGAKIKLCRPGGVANAMHDEVARGRRSRLGRGAKMTFQERPGHVSKLEYPGRE